MKTIHVVYHGHCPDGILAAAVFEHIVGLKLPEGMIEYTAISYGSESEQLKALVQRAAVERDSSNLPDFIFLDYCPAFVDYVTHLQYYKCVIVDHHDDRVREIKEKSLTNSAIIIDNDLFGVKASGAKMSMWLAKQMHYGDGELYLDMFYIRKRLIEATLEVDYSDVVSEYVYNLVNSISDYDTWTLADEDTSAIMFNGLGIYAASNDWDVDTVTNLLAAGKSIYSTLANMDAGSRMQIKEAISRAYNYPSDENPIITFINAPKSLASEIGRLIFKEINTSAVFVYNHNLKQKRMDISIRSADNTPISALRLAKLFNGGGHENAAGCRLEIVESPMTFILGDLEYALLASVVSQIKNPRK